MVLKQVTSQFPLTIITLHTFLYSCLSSKKEQIIMFASLNWHSLSMIPSNCSRHMVNLTSNYTISSCMGAISAFVLNTTCPYHECTAVKVSVTWSKLIYSIQDWTFRHSLWIYTRPKWLLANMLSTGRILSLYPILCVPKVNPWMARGKSAPIVPPVPAPAQVAHMALASDSDLTATSTQIEIITRMTLRQFQGNKIERRKKKATTW